MDSFNTKLSNHCISKNNRLCIGLDIDIDKLKIKSISFMSKYIKDIIDATIKDCPIYKINFAFYEKLGSEGFSILENIPKYIDSRSLVIADSKRGDIGNSSKYYADAIFKTLNYDAITVSPYMGKDSIEPFCQYKDKGVFILCLTSNSGSENFQNKILDDEKLYIKVAKLALKMNINNNIGLVVGATKYDKMKELKKVSMNLPWLIPGVGFQGGSLKESINLGSKNDSIPIINVSRGIIGNGSNTIGQIRENCKYYSQEIRKLL